MSLHVLRSAAELSIQGDGYVEPNDAEQLVSASALLTQFAEESQSLYASWANEKDKAVESELLRIRQEERSQVAALLLSSTDAMKEAIEQARSTEIEKIRSALMSAFSESAADVLIAAGLAKATEAGLIDADSKILVPEYAKERLIEHLGQLIPFDDYLFLTKVVEEHDYVSEGSAILVTPVEAFKFDAQAMARGLLS
jgi:hypothetical protein